jgi:phage gp36-like protein
VAYSTQADLEDACGGAERLVQLADWDRDGIPDAPRIADAIAKADALIDSFASKQFHVPFSPVPPIIAQHSATLAKLNLARRRGQLTQDELEEWDSITSTDAKKPGWLYLLARGVVTPGGDPLPLAHSTMVTDTVETTMPGDRDAARDKLAGFW